MAALVTAAPAGYAPATITTGGIVARLGRRAQWSIPLLGWNLSMLYLNTVEHSPVLLAISAGSLAIAALLVATEPDDIEA